MAEEPHRALQRFLLRLLRRMLPPDWADDIVLDMEETLGRRRSAGHRLRANLWLGGQMLLFGCRFTVERLRERWSRSATTRWLEVLGQDVRHTFRSVRRTPLFYGTVVVTLAVGIGPNTAIFSVVDSVLLNPLPYPDSDRLVTLSPYPWVRNEIILDVQATGRGIDELTGFYPRRFAVTGVGPEPIEMEGARVTHDFLDVFRAGFALGRDFVPGDAGPSATRTAIISHGAWVRRFSQSPDVLGRVIEVNGEPHEIIGVTERGFRPLAPRIEDQELWIPFEILLSPPDGFPPWIIPVARLSGTVPVSQSQADLTDAITAFRQSLEPGERFSSNYRWATLSSVLTGDVRPALLVLQLSVGVLLLLACVNVANLLLVRSNSRQAEVAVRTALGASKGRLFRQLLTESLVLSVMGGLTGLLLMVVSIDLILAVAPEEVRRLSDISLDSRVLLFAMSMSIGTGLLFGIVPAIAATGRAPHEFLKDAGRTMTGSKRKHRFSQGLVIAEVTLTLVLVVSAGLLVRTFVSLSDQAPGFRSENVLAVSLTVPQTRYQTVARLDGFYGGVLERLTQIPGVEAVGLSNNLPISRGGATRAFRLAGKTESRIAQYGVVSPGYFQALEIPLLRGRYLGDGDHEEAVPVALIDESMWRDMWPDENPLGGRFQLDNDTDTWWTVVGVVGDIRGSGLANGPEPGFYISHRQRPDTPTELAVGHNVVFLSASAIPVETLSNALRQGVWEVDPSQPVPEIMTLESILSERVTPQRFRALLLAAFAIIALVLAMAGMYGVIGQLLAERMHEFGVRQAIGATKNELLGRVMRWGMSLTAIGLVLGLAGALVLSRFLASMLFGVRPTDPSTLGLSVVVVLAIALSACIGPALRARRIDPVAALRAER